MSASSAAPASDLRASSPAPALHGADVAAVLLGAFVVLVPFLWFRPFVSLYNSQRLTEVGVLALAVLAVATVRGAAALRTGAAQVPRGALAALAGAVGLGVLSALRAPRLLEAAAEVGMVVVMAGLALALAGRWRAGEANAKAVVQAIAVAAAAAYVGVVYVEHAASLLKGGDGWPNVMAGFGNRRSLNQLQVIIVPIVIALATEVEGGGRWRAGRWGLRLLGALHVSVLLASGARAATLGLVLGCLVLVAVQRRRSVAVLREWGGVVAAGAALHWAVFMTVGASRSYLRNEVTAGRAPLWEAAQRMIADRPMTGVGPMHYAYYETPIASHPHNAILQLAAEWGLPATVLLVGVVLWGAAAWLGAASQAAERPDRRVWRGALTVALVASLVSGLFDSFLMVPSSQAWAILLLGALLAEYGRMQPSRRVAPEASRWGRLAVVLGAALAFGPVLALTIRDAPTLHRRSYDRQAWMEPLPLRPRFWQVGTIAPPEGPPRDVSQRYWPEPLPPRRDAPAP